MPRSSNQKLKMNILVWRNRNSGDMETASPELGTARDCTCLAEPLDFVRKSGQFRQGIRRKTDMLIRSNSVTSGLT